jgi:hypothetical protein
MTRKFITIEMTPEQLTLIEELRAASRPVLSRQAYARQLLAKALLAQAKRLPADATR